MFIEVKIPLMPSWPCLHFDEREDEEPLLDL
jgi:hypothetical protein